MSSRGPKLKSHGIFLNEDLSRCEQTARRNLVPVLKEFREKGVRCLLDRACLVAGDRHFFGADEARSYLTSVQSSGHTSTLNTTAPSK